MHTEETYFIFLKSFEENKNLQPCEAAKCIGRVATRTVPTYAAELDRLAFSAFWMIGRTAVDAIASVLGLKIALAIIGGKITVRTDIITEEWGGSQCFCQCRIPRLCRHLFI